MNSKTDAANVSGGPEWYGDFASDARLLGKPVSANQDDEVKPCFGTSAFYQCFNRSCREYAACEKAVSPWRHS